MARPYARYSVKLLGKGLQDENEVIRAEVAHEIGLRGDEALPVLANLIRAAGYDPEACVRGVAVTALAQLASDDVDVLRLIEAQEKEASYPERACLTFARERVEVATGIS